MAAYANRLHKNKGDMCWSTLNEKMEKAECVGLVKKDFYSFMGGRDGNGYSAPCAGNSIGFAGTHVRIADKDAAKL